MSNQRLSDLFVTITKADGFNEPDIRAIWAKIRDLYPIQRGLAVIETGKSGNLHLHYAIQLDQPILTNNYRNKIKTIYQQHITTEYNRKTIHIKTIKNFYDLAGGYLGKESNRKVIFEHNIDKDQLAQGAVNYKLNQKQREYKLNRKTRIQLYVEHFTEYLNNQDNDNLVTNEQMLFKALNQYIKDTHNYPPISQSLHSGGYLRYMLMNQLNIGTEQQQIDDLRGLLNCQFLSPVYTPPDYSSDED